jgi:hypothetical protein
MDHTLTLIGVGIGCVIAAIVGGGLKVFALELPLVNSVKRQTLLGLLGSLIIVGTVLGGKIAQTAQEATSEVVSPIDGSWTLTDATDNEGDNWSNSTLALTSHDSSEDGFQMTGVFTWHKNGESSSSESVSGHYAKATRRLTLQADSGSYSAVLDADDRTLTDGQWKSADDAAEVMGQWRAVR